MTTDKLQGRVTTDKLQCIVTTDKLQCILTTDKLQYIATTYKLQCIVGWCEIKLLLKSQNPQEVYGSLIIPEQRLSKVFGHRMYQFLRN